MAARLLLSTLLTIACPALVVTTNASMAWADRQSPTKKEKAEAAKLKEQGDEAMVALRYADALKAYIEAFKLVDDPALLYNQGRALQGLGRFPEALEMLEKFNEDAPRSLKARVPGLKELIAEVRNKVSTLSLTCNVEGARLLVNDKVVATTPLERHLSINAGRAVVRVEAEGYFPYEKTMELPGGGKTSLDVKLVTKSTMGILTVQSPTPGVRVSVDDHITGNVPSEVTVRAGTHTIVVEGDGYDTSTTTVVVAAGERKQITIALEKKKPLIAHWWFWAGVGVVAIGGAVLTGALLSDGPNSRGTIEPGIAQAPIRF